MSVVVKQNCQLCNESKLTVVLELTPTPPANEFVPAELLKKPQQTFPLRVVQCEHCFHVQLCDIVDRSLLFDNYVYVSGTSPVFINHFKQYATDVAHILNLDHNDFVIDIGSNDGTLLSFFKDMGCSVLGIDPATSIANTATKHGIETLPIFFNNNQATQLVKNKGQAKLILANNVFAHVADLTDFTMGIKSLLKPDGLFVFEVSYLVDVYEKTLFDTIYHEHTSYHSVCALKPFFERLGLELQHVQRIDTHGGSIRCFVQHKQGPLPINPSVNQLITYESNIGLASLKAMQSFNQKIDSIKHQFVLFIEQLKSSGKTIAGFGAPAKATTLLYYFGISQHIIDFIVDDSPLKQGLYSPGMHIPIVDSSILKDDKRCPDYLIILAWNFAKPIINNHGYFIKNGGQFIVPLPTFEVIS